jgi:hypothetical protein
MNTKKINKLQNGIKLKQDKLQMEEDVKKKQVLRLQISIDELKVKLEKLK